MIRQFKNYIERVKNIGDNPFWATAQNRARRTPTWKTLWRVYAGYALLLVLPLCLVTNYVFAGTQSFGSAQHDYAVFLSALGVLQLLYVSIKASMSTAPSVVQARQQGTLLALALTRINSADFADGVALADSRNILREFLVWTPLVAAATWLAGQSLFSTVMLTVISALCVLYFAYSGILISATSKDSQEAGRKASQQPFVTMAGTCLGFLCGGFMLGPLWLLHPVFGYLCSVWGTGSPQGMPIDEGMSLLFWCGWPVFVLPIYAWMVLSVRQSAIRALERVRIA